MGWLAEVEDRRKTHYTATAITTATTEASSNVIVVRMGGLHVASLQDLSSLCRLADASRWQDVSLDKTASSLL